MLEPQVPETTPRNPALAPNGKPHSVPTASRMFAKYLDDVGQLLDERFKDGATVRSVAERLGRSADAVY